MRPSCLLPVTFALSLAANLGGQTPPVAPGITYSERHWSHGGDGPFAMQVLEVDPSDPHVNILPVRAHDKPAARETVGAMAARYAATAAVNGGYFVVKGPREGASNGVYELNRRVIASGSGRSALLFCAERNFREHLVIDVVKLPGPVGTNSCDPTGIVGGGPRIVRNGAVDIGGEMFAHAAVRHPRTAVAIAKKGTILFVTLQNRNSPRSAQNSNR